MNRKVLISSIIGMIIVFAIVLTNVTNTKGANSKAHEYKYYISVQVEEGDTLWSIAEDYMTVEYDTIGDYISEVKRINNLGDDTIYAGNYIIVPHYSNEKR